jgi:hypothetical protein
MSSNEPRIKVEFSTDVIAVENGSTNHSSNDKNYHDINDNKLSNKNSNDSIDSNDSKLIGDVTKDSKVVLLPYILLEDHILVPIKLDITYCGARLVDSFSWNISNNSYMSINEFSLHTCIDLNLPLGFESKISAQIKEQVDGYKSIIYIISNYAPIVVKGWIDKINEIQVITLGLRHNSLDYTDKVYWNAMSSYLTPESYACRTCKELGLPLEMRPAISFKIREALFRWLMTLIEYPDNMDIRIMEEFKVSETKITMGHHPHTVEMMSNLWKRAKPSAIEDQSSIPQPLLSSDKNSNATVWMT